MREISIISPLEGHVHFRDEEMLRAVAPFTARQFSQAIVMPNLVPPVRNAGQALAYQDRIKRVAGNPNFEPLMTLYLTDATTPDEVEEAFKQGVIAVKYYPRGATTNSESGVTDLKNVYGVIERMQRIGMPLLLHGERNEWKGDRVDPYDKEKVFISEDLLTLRYVFEGLKMVLEHITTRQAVDLIRSLGSPLLAATITAQHLIYDRADMHDHGLHTNLVCMPILKRREDLLALRRLATSGNPYVYLGTDSAPHPQQAKERCYGCASGCFTSPFALELYTQVFAEENALEHLGGFTSLNGRRFHGIAIPEEMVTLREETWVYTGSILTESGEAILPLYPPNRKNNIELQWRMN